MKIINLFKAKVTFSVALFILVAIAICSEQLLLEEIKADNVSGYLNAIGLTPGQRRVSFWPSDIKERVALANTNIPLMPGAERMTFGSNDAVRYRVNATAEAVASFYGQILTWQGWKTAAKISPNNKSEKLTIAFAENPISNKTDITYTYVPADETKVLGVKIAEADASAPAPEPQPLPPAPAPEPPMPQPQQPVLTPEEQPASDQNQLINNQPQPPMPEAPRQPMDQQNVNQMEFSRPTQPMSGPQGGNQTCRVNGADLPGSCEQYNNNQGSINQGGQKMGQPGQPGMSDEEIKKNDERRFKDMKKGLSQFSSGAKSMKRNLARVKTAISKCGVGMPEELVNALAQTDSLVEKINAAKTADELDEIVGDIQDVGSVMQDWGPRMGDLSRLCQILKRADRDAKQFDRNIKRLESQAKTNKKVDLSELIAEFKMAVNAQKDALAQAKELAKTDPDSALAKIEDDFYGNMDNLGNLQMQINTVINISKGIKDISRELTTFASQIKTLTKKKLNTADMQELLNNLKAQVAEIKNLVKGKIDPEELIAKIEGAFDTRQELQDALQEYDMIKTMPQISAGSGYNVKINLPDAFKKSENSADSGESSSGQSY